MLKVGDVVYIPREIPMHSISKKPEKFSRNAGRAVLRSVDTKQAQSLTFSEKIERFCFEIVGENQFSFSECELILKNEEVF